MAAERTANVELGVRFRIKSFELTRTSIEPDEYARSSAAPLGAVAVASRVHEPATVPLATALFIPASTTIVGRTEREPFAVSILSLAGEAAG